MYLLCEKSCREKYKTNKKLEKGKVYFGTVRKKADKVFTSKPNPIYWVNRRSGLGFNARNMIKIPSSQSIHNYYKVGRV